MRSRSIGSATMSIGVAAMLLLSTVSLGCGDDQAGAGGGQTTGAGGSVGVGASSGSGNGVGEPCGDAPTFTGEATYYDFADGSGNCSFPATPNDLMVAAMNHTDYAGSAACGACVRIDGPNGSVDVRVVDRCPECPAGDIDLSPAAFEQIAALEEGRVPISWQYIECPVSGGVIYHFKDGSNEYWTAVQIRNHRHAIKSLAYQNASGDFVDVPRLDYNYFVADPGMGPGPYVFRVTDVLGNTIEDSGIALGDDIDVPGTAQFEPCPL